MATNNTHQTKTAKKELPFGKLRVAGYAWRATRGGLRVAGYAWRATRGGLRVADYAWRATRGKLCPELANVKPIYANAGVRRVRRQLRHHHLDVCRAAGRVWKGEKVSPTEVR